MNRRIRNLLLTVCFLILVCSGSICEEESGHSRSFVTVGNYVPLEIRTSLSDITSKELVDTHGIIHPHLGYLIHPSITNDDTVITGDISAKRVLLLLDDSHDNMYVNIALWNWDRQEYTFTRSKFLPEFCDLDMYHDADAVLLSIGYITDDYFVSEDPDDLLWFYYTIELNDSDEWIVSNITDGFTFMAEQEDYGFSVIDYDDMIKLQDIQCTFYFSDFDFANANNLFGEVFSDTGNDSLF